MERSDFQIIYVLLLVFTWMTYSPHRVLSDPFVATIVTINRNDTSPYGYMRVAPGIDMALDRIRAEFNETIDLQFIYKPTASHCTNHYVATSAAEVYYTGNITAFIGPSCSAAVETLGYMASDWNIPIISTYPGSALLDDKTEFTTLTRLSSELLHPFPMVVQHVMRRHKWRHIAFVYDKSREEQVTQVHTFVEHFENTFFLFQTLGIDPKTDGSEEFQKALTTVSLNARIIFLFFTSEVANEILLAARELGFTSGEFVFFRLFAASDSIMSFPDQTWRLGNQTAEVMKEIYQCVLLITSYKMSSASFKNFQQEANDRSIRDYGLDFAELPASNQAALFFDAFMIYAKMLNETLSEGLDPLDGRALSRRMWNRTHAGGVSGDAFINSEGDRDTDVYVVDMTDPVEGTFKEISIHNATDGDYTDIPDSAVHWPGNRGPPPDIPACGFRSELCDHADHDDKIFYYSIGSLAVLVGVGLSVSYMIYRRWKTQMKTSLWWWCIDDKDVTVLDNCIGNSRLSLVSKEVRSPDFAIYKGTGVTLRHLPNLKHIHISKQLLDEFKNMREINQTNLVRMVGACLKSDVKFLLNEFCSKGSLQDLLSNSTIGLDAQFKYSLCIDVVQGMSYLHTSPVHHHGRLTSAVCLIDNRFSVKISDFGLPSIYNQMVIDVSSHEYKQACLCKAPEILNSSIPCMASREGDIYSFGIILQEIITRDSPFSLETDYIGIDTLLEKIRAGRTTQLRLVDNVPSGEEGLANLMKQCLTEYPADRPTFQKIKVIISQQASNNGFSKNLFDNLLKRMEMYANNLEKVVDEKTKQLNNEKKKSEELLYQILPRSIADSLKEGRHIKPESYDCVTLYFSDIVGFTALSAVSTPFEVVNLLNDLYTCFDGIIENFDVYKVETIGDAYMVVSGLPVRNGNNHAREIARMSMAMLKGIINFRIRHIPDRRVEMRIGLHSGTVCAGVVGLKMPRYCLFGDTVNMCSRMESTGEAMKIHISPDTREILTLFQTFEFIERGAVNIKGKGLVNTYWLLGEKSNLEVYDGT